MAEGFLRQLADDRFEVASAGTEATRVHPSGRPGDAPRWVSTSVRIRRRPWTLCSTVHGTTSSPCVTVPMNGVPCSPAILPGCTGASTTRPKPRDARTNASVPSGAFATRFRLGSGTGWPRRAESSRTGDARKPMTARLATLADADAIARIYNQGIEDRIATFETEPRSTGQIEAQLAEKGDRYPTIVVERDGDILAFAERGTVPDTGGVCRGGRALRLHGPACARSGGRPSGAGRLEPGVCRARLLEAGLADLS